MAWALDTLVAFGQSIYILYTLILFWLLQEYYCLCAHVHRKNVILEKSKIVASCFYEDYRLHTKKVYVSIFIAPLDSL